MELTRINLSDFDSLAGLARVRRGVAPVGLPWSGEKRPPGARSGGERAARGRRLGGESGRVGSGCAGRGFGCLLERLRGEMRIPLSHSGIAMAQNRLNLIERPARVH